MPQRFDDIADILLAVGSAVSPAELHGQLVGQLCLGHMPTKDQWLRQINDISGARVESGSRYGDDLVDWLHEVYELIVDEDFVFELLLPDEDELINERMEELAIWSKSFTTGIAIAASLKGDAGLPEEADELYNDIVAISQLDSEGDIDETPESDLDQIIEYVRVGVIQLALEAKESAEAETGSATLH